MKIRSAGALLLACMLSSAAAARAAAPAPPPISPPMPTRRSPPSIRPGQPGAAAIVVKDGKVVLRKGYGMANLELGVAMAPDMVFELGSITKQFTAAAILLLQERGKLRVEDDDHEVPARLSHPRRDDHDREPAHPHLRDPQLHRPPGVVPPHAGGHEARRRRRPVQGQAAGVQPRRKVVLRQLGLLPARDDHREGLGQEL